MLPKKVFQGKRHRISSKKTEDEGLPLHLTNMPASSQATWRDSMEVVLALLNHFLLFVLG